ncbi:hypothetical protein [Streptomyces sp. NBC_01304]|uniref:hypothetical protein n=1 Tax=Streptomyces sp. NBC_01304 TaxID=2903818 RepID=UPI002E154DE5|nr:hypothetical protein OG430_42150 [Streptomyces sp. NBC_01304]
MTAYELSSGIAWTEYSAKTLFEQLGLKSRFPHLYESGGDFQALLAARNSKFGTFTFEQWVNRSFDSLKSLKSVARDRRSGPAFLETISHLLPIPKEFKDDTNAKPTIAELMKSTREASNFFKPTKEDPNSPNPVRILIVNGGKSMRAAEVIPLDALAAGDGHGSACVLVLPENSLLEQEGQLQPEALNLAFQLREAVSCLGGHYSEAEYKAPVDGDGSEAIATRSEFEALGNFWTMDCEFGNIVGSAWKTSHALGGKFQKHLKDLKGLAAAEADFAAAYGALADNRQSATLYNERRFTGYFNLERGRSNAQLKPRSFPRRATGEGLVVDYLAPKEGVAAMGPMQYTNPHTSYACGELRASNILWERMTCKITTQANTALDNTFTVTLGKLIGVFTGGVGGVACAGIRIAIKLGARIADAYGNPVDPPGVTVCAPGTGDHPGLAINAQINRIDRGWLSYLDSHKTNESYAAGRSMERAAKGWAPYAPRLLMMTAEVAKTAVDVASLVGTSIDSSGVQYTASGFGDGLLNPGGIPVNLEDLGEFLMESGLAQGVYESAVSSADFSGFNQGAGSGLATLGDTAVWQPVSGAVMDTATDYLAPLHGVLRLFAAAAGLGSSAIGRMNRTIDKLSPTTPQLKARYFEP